MTERVALIGAGAMGGAIGTRLLETGNSLAVFDLDAQKVAELVAKGGIAATSAAEAAAQSDYVITSLNSPGIVRMAVFGEAGVAEGARPGTIIIDMLPGSPTRLTTSLSLEAMAMARGRMCWVARGRLFSFCQ